MTKHISITTIIIFALILSASPVIGDDDLSLVILGRGSNQADPLLLVVGSARGLAAASGEFLGKQLNFSDYGGKQVAFIAIDRNQKQGSYDMTVTVTFSDGSKARVTRRMEIAGTAFETQQLNVNPDFVTLSKENLARVRRESALLAKVYASGDSGRLWQGAFTWPVTAKRSAPFGVKRIFNGEERSYHRGYDLAVGTGTVVRSSNDGRVVLARNLYFGGNTIIVDHGMGVFTGYLHLSEFRVKEGGMVESGEVIGLSGATGRVTGPHLHWMLRINGIMCDASGLLEIDID